MTYNVFGGTLNFAVSIYLCQKGYVNTAIYRAVCLTVC